MPGIHALNLPGHKGARRPFPLVEPNRPGGPHEAHVSRRYGCASLSMSALLMSGRTCTSHKASNVIDRIFTGIAHQLEEVIHALGAKWLRKGWGGVGRGEVWWVQSAKL